MAAKPVIMSNATDIGKVDLNININLPYMNRNSNQGNTSSNYATLARTLKLTPKMKRNIMRNQNNTH